MAPTIHRAVVDIATAWDMYLRMHMRRDSAIIALRGAGSTGGIDPQAAEYALQHKLVPLILGYLKPKDGQPSRSVVVMYDGDRDDPARPDIGYIAGRLLDRFSDFIADGRVTFLTAQADSWYYPPDSDLNLTNVNGLEFESFKFPNGVYPGEHNRFTQSEELAAYEHYWQIYIGGGMIAASQMVDYCNKVPVGKPVNIRVIRALINQALDQVIGDQLAAAVDEAKRRKLAAQLEQRRQRFGSQWGNNGELDVSFLGEFERTEDTHEIVVIWKSPDDARVANCRRIDLNSEEYDRQFAKARLYQKTEPIWARQVPEGESEVVPVKSGATTDTANAGDFIVTSLSGEEYKGAGDFLKIYELVEDEPAQGRLRLYRPKFDPRKLIKQEEDVIFMAPWGELQAVLAGGYLMQRTVRSDSGVITIERYGISEADAADMTPL